jgi:ABC-type branched-subunit amino acid transport system substrate-binding protein
MAGFGAMAGSFSMGRWYSCSPRFDGALIGSRAGPGQERLTMKISKRTALAAVLASVLFGTAGAAPKTPIRIGEINSYSAIPQFTQPYRQGWQLAVEEINQAGGLLGRPVEVIARDDAGRPEEALRHAVS